MKATLTFNLPEDRYEHETAINAAKYRHVLFEVNEKMRSLRKHGHKFTTANAMLEHIWELLHEEISGEGIEI